MSGAWDRASGRPWLFAAACIAAALLLAIAPRPAAGSAAPGIGPEFFGVSGRHLSPQDLDLMERAGIGTHRMLFHLASAKRRNRPYDWERFDHAVRVTARRGITLLPMVYGSPRWLHPRRGVPPTRSQQARAEWRAFLVALVRRYGPGGRFWLLNPLVPTRPITAWQIWNEPNHPSFWFPRPRPAEYANLLDLSARAIRAVDRGARIVGAGIVAAPRARYAVSGPRYLDQLLGFEPARRVLNAVAYHPYGATGMAVHRHLVVARQVMRSRGMGRLPIWVTEFGWGSEGPVKRILVKTEEGQARALRIALALVRRDRRWLGIERILWYNWRDSWDSFCIWCRSAGLLSRHVKPKPAFEAFRFHAGG